MKSYNLRGTNGSGKTTVAKALMEEALGTVPILRSPKGKILAYEGKLHDVPIVFLGSYESRCGGCDTIDSVAKVAALLETFMGREENGIVFFEGLMISHMLGTVGAMQTKLGKQRNVLAFLDTPLEVCIKRVEMRRRERADYREFDPRNIIADHPRVVSCKMKALKEGYTVIDVNHDNALEQVKTDLQTLVTGDL